MRVRSITGIFGVLLVGVATVTALAAPANAEQSDTPKPPGVPAPPGMASVGVDDVGTLSCAHPHTNRDTRAVGRLFDADFVRMRSGPHVACTALGQGQRSHNVDYHCFTDGDTVTANGTTLSTWTFLTDTTTRVSGWVSDTLLDRNPTGSRGSTVRCR